jgi:hypothetical protein
LGDPGVLAFELERGEIGECGVLAARVIKALDVDEYGGARLGSVGDCYDNALCETFHASIKNERIYRRSWPTRAAARVAVFEYIEGWYNPRRRRLYQHRFQRGRSLSLNHARLTEPRWGTEPSQPGIAVCPAGRAAGVPPRPSVTFVPLGTLGEEDPEGLVWLLRIRDQPPTVDVDPQSTSVIRNWLLDMHDLKRPHVVPALLCPGERLLSRIVARNDLAALKHNHVMQVDDAPVGWVVNGHGLSMRPSKILSTPSEHRWRVHQLTSGQKKMLSSAVAGPELAVKIQATRVRPLTLSAVGNGGV